MTTKIENCPACGGEGTEIKQVNGYYRPVDCYNCNGKGWVETVDEKKSEEISE